MGFISPVQKEEIRNRVPLEELLRDYNVQLLPAGRKLRGLCPFHQEKTPSFYVDPEKQLYYCYGCQEGGDLFRLVQVLDRLEFGEAVELLARRAGVVLEAVAHGGGARDRRGVIELYDALAFAASWYHHLLLKDPRGEPARQYLRSRGINEEMWRHFQLGYSLPEWDGLLSYVTRGSPQRRESARQERRFPVTVLERTGLVRQRERSREGGYYDTFRGRLMFPITDVQNRVIGFGARTLGDDVPKYINTPKTALFDKSHVLYGLAQAKEGSRRERQIGIVEGYTDAIVAHQAGLDYFVASLGTAFTSQNARSLGRLARQVVMVFDGDAAGQKASERSMDLLVGHDLDVQVYSLQGGQDPCDAILLLGGQEFRRRVDSEAVGIFEFKWGRTVGALPKDARPSLRASALDEFLRLVLRVPNVVARKLILREYVERLGVREKDIDERLSHLSKSAVTSESDALRGPTSDPEQVAQGEPIGPLAERIVECLIALPGKAALLWGEVPKELFTGEAGQALVNAISTQLTESSFSGVRLARELEHPEANRVVVKVLSRLERDDDSLKEDYESVWQYCRRDIERWCIRTRVKKLEDLRNRARTAGDQEKLQAYSLERRRLLKELKR